MILEKEVNRRNFLRYAGAIVVGTVDLPYSQASQPLKNNQTSCGYPLATVRAGLVSPAQYVEEYGRCMPEVQLARRSGKLEGFLYNPTDEQIESILRQTLSGVIKNPAHLESRIQEQISSYRTSKNSGQALATLVCGAIEAFGEKIPMHVAFFPNLLSNSGISTDLDMRSLTLHELEHVGDFWGGINLGNIYLSRPLIEQGKMRVEYLGSLMELRGAHKELEVILPDLVAKLTFSPFLASRLGKYEKYSNEVKETTTGLERDSGNIQLENFKDIVLERNGGMVKVRFILNGVRYSFDAPIKKS